MVMFGLELSVIGSILLLNFGAHIVNESIIDRSKLLRGVCRGKTQIDTANILKTAITEAVSQGICNKEKLEEVV